MVTSTLFRQQDRTGTALVLTALALVPLLAMVAFAVDWGRICLTKAELQRAADAAALAGAWELLDAKSPARRLNPAAALAKARQAAIDFSARNTALGEALKLHPADVEIGYLAESMTPDEPLDTSDPSRANAVRVRARRDGKANGAIPMYFARIIGSEKVDARASATAAFVGSVIGFQKPLQEQRDASVPILPFALDLATWSEAADGGGNDQWKWDSSKKRFVPGSDGIPEVNLYPQTTGAKGNSGTVNIGTHANSTSHVARQILNGVSPSDLAFHGGKLKFNARGEVVLSGDPGISAGFKDELKAIRGQPRIVPVFSHLEGDGNNAAYTIVKWAGIRLIEVDLTSDNKFILIQPAKITTGGVIAGPETSSENVYSRVWLAQ